MPAKCFPLRDNQRGEERKKKHLETSRNIPCTLKKEAVAAAEKGAAGIYSRRNPGSVGRQPGERDLRTSFLFFWPAN